MHTLLSVSPDDFVPFFAMFFTFLIPILIIYVYNQQKKRVMEERRLMIEKGLVPPSIHEGMQPYPSAGRNPLHRGLNMIAIALGLIAGYFIYEATHLHMPFCIIGAILFFLGLSNIIIALNNKKTQEQNNRHE